MKGRTAAILAMSLYSCQTTKPDAEMKSVVVVEAASGGEAGFTSFFVEGDVVLRYRCPAQTLGEGSDQQPIDDPKFLKAKCAEASSITGNKVLLPVFEGKLKNLYLGLVDDQELSAQEADVLKNLVASLEASPGAKPELAHAAAERPALDRIETRFVGLLDRAYDFEDASPAPKATSSAAGAGRELVRLKFKSTFSGAAPFVLELPVPAGAPVERVVFATKLEPEGECRTRVVGLAAVNSRKGVPYFVVSLKKPALTLAQSCILVASEGAEAPAKEPPAAAPSLAQESWHFLWHGIRNAWPRMTSADRLTVRQVLGDAWGRSADETVQNPEKDRGEEFLHAHRSLTAGGAGTPPGEVALDDTQLKQMTLGEFGAFVELSLPDVPGVGDLARKWLEANGFDKAADDCAGAAKCYQWKRVWDGPLPGRGSPAEAAAAARSAVAEDGAHRESGAEKFRNLPKTLARLIRANSGGAPEF